MFQPTIDAGLPIHQDLASTPTRYGRRVLLAVCGLSPQIVTETLYALATQPDESGACFVPTEVHLLTTGTGARQAELSLLSQDRGWFHKLCADYQLTGIVFDRSHIHVMCDADGHLMDDIRTGENNHDAANFITAQVRRFSADPDCALHVSIAGGRKTMGFYLGYALSLYGRAQDRLSHVLVSEPFESSWDFFYPSPDRRVINIPNKGVFDTATAQVSLAIIPFVSLRHATAMVDGNASFDETVQAARKALAPAHLTLDLKGRRILAGGKVIELPPAELALLAVFARRVSQGEAPLAAPAKESPDADWAERYLREYRAIGGLMTENDTTTKALRWGMDGNYFSQRKSKLEKRLKNALCAAADNYCIKDGGTRPRLYALALPADAVVFASHTEFRGDKQ